MKRCSKCRQTKTLSEFSADRSRADGRSYVCRECRVARTKPGPSDLERQRMSVLNVAWCSGCKRWLPCRAVRIGRCQPCRNADYRARYAASETFREARKAAIRKRKRGVEIVPVVAREMLLDDFNGVCAYCPAAAATWDHVVPVAAGGQTDPWNVVPACQSCNSSKRDRDVVEWALETGRSIKPEVLDRVALEYCAVG